ncbi:MAG: tRNA threonylcarbamoyladenosine dehydratase [Ruminococcaceae bacterium]|nr:tRNA threonylcarbamoyladenosine dehydratase [Oscillospiraceae bacterium]
MSMFQRTAQIIGDGGVALLAQKRVAVFGVGGVGGAVCEALARAGIGGLALFDDDTVAESNLNRQLVALRSTLGRRKVDVMAERIADINPACTVEAHPVFYTPDNAHHYPFAGYSYVVDAVDTVSAKLQIIVRAKRAGVPVISAMGAGNRLHPERFEVTDIAKTSGCPLARVMRRELKKLGVTGVQVVYSQEPPVRHGGMAAQSEAPTEIPDRPGALKPNPPGSISFVPVAAGMVVAGAVVRDLLGLA